MSSFMLVMTTVPDEQKGHQIARRRIDDRGIEWLKGFAGGLLTSCGPMNIGRPTTDQDEELGVKMFG